jgi:putative molybdopterin biosynthesis protein
MEMMTAREMSGYLKINEKKIYQLAKESSLPHLWIGGKIAFPKELVDRWIMEKTEGSRHITVAGSDDPLLRRILDVFNASSESLVFYAPIGSINGLKALQKRAARASCVHIIDIESKKYNTTYVQRYLGGATAKVVHLFVRQQGLYVEAGNPKGIGSFTDVARNGLTFVNRNKGSGTRLLVDYLLKGLGIASQELKGYDTEVESHLEAGLTVLRREADCTVGIRNVAHMLDLDFIPLHSEEFHLVLLEEDYASKAVKDFLSIFDQSVLVRHLGDLTGYDISRMGKVL